MPSKVLVGNIVYVIDNDMADVSKIGVAFIPEAVFVKAKELIEPNLRMLYAIKSDQSEYAHNVKKTVCAIG
jgi:hypothetical protein